MIAAAVILKGNPTSGPMGPAPTAAFILTLNPAQQGNTVVFLDKSSNSPTAWQWTVNGSTFSNIQNPGFYCGSVGNFIVQLTATNAYGSNTSAPQTLRVTP